MIFETQRTICRKFTQEDLEELHAIHSHPKAMEFLVGGVRADKMATLQDLMKYIDHEKKFGYGKWANVHKETGRLMGRSGLVNVPETGEIDLGYALHPDFWGQGLAYEIATGLLKYYKKHLSHKPVVGIVKPGNAASIKILEKIGMHHTGCEKYFGEMFEIYRL